MRAISVHTHQLHRHRVTSPKLVKEQEALIPMSSPDITLDEIRAVNEVLRTPYLSIGPRIGEFEREFARYTGVGYGVGVNSGTSGLHLTMIAAGIEDGDEVITSSFSFIATANCVLY